MDENDLFLVVDWVDCDESVDDRKKLAGNCSLPAEDQRGWDERVVCTVSSERDLCDQDMILRLLLNERWKRMTQTFPRSGSRDLQSWSEWNQILTDNDDVILSRSSWRIKILPCSREEGLVQCQMTNARKHLTVQVVNSWSWQISWKMYEEKFYLLTSLVVCSWIPLTCLSESRHFWHKVNNSRRVPRRIPFKTKNQTRRRDGLHQLFHSLQCNENQTKTFRSSWVCSLNLDNNSEGWNDVVNVTSTGVTD